MEKFDSSLRASLTQAQIAIRQDHCHLDEFTRRLQKASDMASLVSILQEMYPRLLAHFAQEERSRGIYQVLARCVPEQQDALHRMVEQHQELTEDMGKLLTRARQESATGFATVRQQVEGFLQKLREHEAGEQQLIEDALARSKADS